MVGSLAVGSVCAVGGVMTLYWTWRPSTRGAGLLFWWDPGYANGLGPSKTTRTFSYLVGVGYLLIGAVVLATSLR